MYLGEQFRIVCPDIIKQTIVIMFVSGFDQAKRSCFVRRREMEVCLSAQKGVKYAKIIGVMSLVFYEWYVGENSRPPPCVSTRYLLLAHPQYFVAEAK